MCEGIELLKKKAADDREAETQKKDIKAAYQAMKDLSPDAKDKDIFAILVKRYEKTLAYIKEIFKDE